MTWQKWRLHWGVIRGLGLTWLYLNFCAITCLTKNKRWKYGYICFLPSSFSFLQEWWDNKSFTRAWVKHKIGRGTVIVPYQERSCAMCACDITPLNGGLSNIMWRHHEQLWLTLLFLNGRRSWETFRSPNPSWPFLGRSAEAKPRAVLNLVDTRYCTQTRPLYEWHLTRSSPEHRYIHKGGWNLGTW